MPQTGRTGRNIAIWKIQMLKALSDSFTNFAAIIDENYALLIKHVFLSFMKNRQDFHVFKAPVVW